MCCIFAIKKVRALQKHDRKICETYGENAMSEQSSQEEEISMAKPYRAVSKKVDEIWRQVEQDQHASCH